MAWCWSGQVVAGRHAVRAETDFASSGPDEHVQGGFLQVFQGAAYPSLENAYPCQLERGMVGEESVQARSYSQTAGSLTCLAM